MSLAVANLQKIDDYLAAVGSSSEGLDKAVAEHVDKAKEALARGDEKEAIAITAKVLERLEKAQRSSSGAA
ncbi:hypothetical protein [Streptomyces sp. WM4235]|uniref:hypothetical protein n=1 Tax=Streptomyces sp. WM4235 TaxID=1415551 RepID=UPI000A55C33E|nr:hypothetical protein [Streptomyces sp. WM4235]